MKINQEKAKFTRDIYNVTRLNREVRAILEGSFPPVWVQGEISNLARPSSGHMYFSLKDKHAQIRCAMFKNRNLSLKFVPENGMEVITLAAVSLYEGRGEFQLIVEQLEPAGVGALQLAFEQLKERLQKEGLFEEGRKKTIPRFARAIGVITSPTGAAIRDILHVLKRRYPGAEIIIYPVPVQGEGSASKISAAIEKAAERNECDVIIISRGGGSLEDLWSFNEESVARSIFHSKIPVVTGIGHESDFTIADFVADRRAPTPSAAAELVSPDQLGLFEQVNAIQKSLLLSMRRIMSNFFEELNHFEKRLPDPVKRLHDFGQRIDDLGFRLQRAVSSSIEIKRSLIFKSGAGINKFNPVQTLKLYQEKNHHIEEQLTTNMSYILEKARNRLDRMSHTLHTVSPLVTLQRGYAIVTAHDNNHIIRSIKEIKSGKEVRTRLANGFFHSTITKIDNNE